MTLPNLETLAQRANQGDTQALETLIANIQDQRAPGDRPSFQGY